jgi:hypothetical protein
MTNPTQLPQKSSCPNHSTPPTIATIFADFVLDNTPEDLVDEDPVAVSEDEAEVEDATDPGDVEVEGPPEDAEVECPTDAEEEVAFAASSVLRKEKKTLISNPTNEGSKERDLRINDIVEQQQRRRRSPRGHYKRMLTIRQPRLAEHGVVVRVRARRVRCEIVCPSEGIVEREV